MERINLAKVKGEDEEQSCVRGICSLFFLGTSRELIWVHMHCWVCMHMFYICSVSIAGVC